WLEARLRKYPRSAIVISHDRELLDQSVDSILHLTEGHLEYYTGGYGEFERQRGERLRLQSAMRVKIEARRAHMQAFVDRFRYKESKARQAQSRLKMIAKLQTLPAAIEEGVAPFRIPSPERPLAPPLLRLEGVSVGYGGPPVLSRLHLRLDVDDRIGLLGVNGSGKSTFARLIAGDLRPADGHLHRDRRMKVAWFHQHQIEALDPADTALDIIRRQLPAAGEAQRRAALAGFGMTAEKVATTVADLSGGERARLLLNLVAMRRPHLLVLDEPTNHLDIDSRRALTDALNDYAGAVILITHDRSLMELVADRLWLVADNTVTPFDGDMEDYARFVLGRAREAAKGSESGKGRPSPAPATPPPSRRVPAAPLKRRLEAAEATLARENALVAEVDRALCDPDLYVADDRRVADLGQRRVELGRRLARAEQDWVAAAEAWEAATAS
ncbi:MAG: ABC-F family ATP-binding cassette domain-containing protein, partial [Caulobacteraceae bacterium]